MPLQNLYTMLNELLLTFMSGSLISTRNSYSEPLPVESPTPARQNALLVLEFIAVDYYSHF
jgi:hypothetical protein